MALGVLNRGQLDNFQTHAQNVSCIPWINHPIINQMRTRRITFRVLDSLVSQRLRPLLSLLERLLRRSAAR